MSALPSLHSTLGLVPSTTPQRAEDRLIAETVVTANAPARCPDCGHPRGVRRGRKAACGCPCHRPPQRAARQVPRCAECGEHPAVTVISVSEFPGAPRYPYPLCAACAARLHRWEAA